MTTAQQLRREILMQLYAARPLRISAGLMERQARQWGLAYSEQSIRREAAFIVGQGLAGETTDPVSGEPLYSITSAGILQHERTNQS